MNIFTLIALMTGHAYSRAPYIQVDIDESGKSAMIFKICTRLITAPLFITGLIMALGVIRAEAAFLKDIRIGEYEGFTRIVFELDRAGDAPSIQSELNGGLSVGFEGTTPDLKRKIPIERSQHVKKLQIFNRYNRLVLLFQLDFEHFRTETFPLVNPPRIALDIHPLAAKAKPLADQPTSTPLSSQDRSATPTGQKSESFTQSRVIEEASKSAKIEAEPSPNTRIAPTPKATIPAKAKSAPNQPTLVRNPPRSSPSSRVVSDAEARTTQSQPKSSSLQFYLVIALVVITIVILALLLLMLLSKHRWTDDKDVPDVNDYLKNQDQRIASLNARIQEQLKRFEEA